MSWDFVYRDETRELDDATRSAADGSFVRLSRGWTHYQSAGSERVRPVVLVHGFSVPYFIWDPTFEALASAGLHPLRYDLYGRGYSDRPRASYDIALFVEQLRELLDTLGAAAVDLVGLSMGGPIASAFAVQHPKRVRKLVLIGPVGARPVPLGVLYKLAVLPGISEIILGLFGTEQMVRNVASDFFDVDHVRLFQERYRIQMRYCGFKRAILSSIRHGMLGAFADVYRKLGSHDTPVMIIWGEKDRTVPFEQSRILREYIPHSEFRAIPACGHIPHYEIPEMVNPILVEFLRGK